jgi:8-oxo-dGTP diphosphatase
VIRRDDRVAIVHRPKYDDWTFPKGKLDRGESFEEAALREVREETGFECELGEELDSTHYHDRHGRPKVVRWWEMTVVGGEFEENDEVDELRWVTPDEARALLTYERDRGVIRAE